MEPAVYVPKGMCLLRLRSIPLTLGIGGLFLWNNQLFTDTQRERQPGGCNSVSLLLDRGPRPRVTSLSLQGENSVCQGLKAHYVQIFMFSYFRLPLATLNLRERFWHSLPFHSSARFLLSHGVSFLQVFASCNIVVSMTLLNLFL